MGEPHVYVNPPIEPTPIGEIMEGGPVHGTPVDPPASRSRDGDDAIAAGWPRSTVHPSASLAEKLEASASSVQGLLERLLAADPTLRIVGFKLSSPTRTITTLDKDDEGDPADDETSVPVELYGAALDEIFALRRALAYEAQVTDVHLGYKTFPKSRRVIGTIQIERMQAAARGDVVRAYAGTADVSLRGAMVAAEAPATMTRAQWEAQWEAVNPAVRGDRREIPTDELALLRYLRARLAEKAGALTHLSAGAGDNLRLAGKTEGVRLAISFIDECLQQNAPETDRTR